MLALSPCTLLVVALAYLSAPSLATRLPGFGRPEVANPNTGSGAVFLRDMLDNEPGAPISPPDGKTVSNDKRSIPSAAGGIFEDDSYNPTRRYLPGTSCRACGVIGNNAHF
ncbi:hypothetical protein PENSPDRAFT_652170, partial [Peniophora sp. CONT]